MKILKWKDFGMEVKEIVIGKKDSIIYRTI